MRLYFRAHPVRRCATIVACASAALLLTACAEAPVNQVSLVTGSLAAGVVAPTQPPEIENLPSYLASADDLGKRCDELEAAGGGKVAAPRLAETRDLLARARAETAAGHRQEAARLVWRADSLIAAIERDLRVPRQDGGQWGGRG